MSPQGCPRLTEEQQLVNQHECDEQRQGIKDEEEEEEEDMYVDEDDAAVTVVHYIVIITSVCMQCKNC